MDLKYIIDNTEGIRIPLTAGFSVLRKVKLLVFSAKVVDSFAPRNETRRTSLQSLGF